jgi:hypothetical protein
MSDVANFFLYLTQRRDLRDQKAALESVRRRLKSDTHTAKATDAELVELWSEVLDLRLFVATLFRLLIDRKFVTADELRSLVEAVDASDGTADGVYRGEVVPGGGGPA